MSELSGNDEQRWCSNREALQALDFPEEEAEKLLRRAFGWTTQKYWRGTKVREVPAPGQVRAAVFRPMTEDTTARDPQTLSFQYAKHLARE